MTRSPPPQMYDDDFFAWTREQAEALRRLPDIATASIDKDNLATEIEDLGRRDLREVQSLLTRLIEHVIKIKALPRAAAVPHWSSEAIHFQSAAADAFSPSMRQYLDVGSIWRRGLKAVRPHLDWIEADRLDVLKCPFSLDDLLAPDFEVLEAIEQIVLN